MGLYLVVEGFYYVYIEVNGYLKGDRGILFLKNLNLSKYILCW